MTNKTVILALLALCLMIATPASADVTHGGGPPLYGYVDTAAVEHHELWIHMPNDHEMIAFPLTCYDGDQLDKDCLYVQKSRWPAQSFYVDRDKCEGYLIDFANNGYVIINIENMPVWLWMLPDEYYERLESGTLSAPDFVCGQ
jgi:hypothetical protein